MSRTPSSDTPAVTRSRIQEGNLLWESLVGVHTRALADLKQFSTETATASIRELSEAVNTVDDNTDLWELWKRLKTVQNQDKIYQRKVTSVEKVLHNLEDEILKTPVSLTEAGIVASADRQAMVNLFLVELDTAQEMYNDWKIRLTQAETTYKRYSHADGTPMSEEDQHHRRHRDPPAAGAGAGRRSRSREKRRGQEAKSLRPDVLTTTFSSAAIQNWQKQFYNYMRASNWNEDEHEIKLSYMRVCLSEEIIQATKFDDKNSVN